MIEVGEYVRTKIGQIDKLHCEITDKWTSKNSYGETIARCENDTYLLKNIVKHSKNIIDLIEECDLVNGKEVYEFDDEEGTVLGIPIFEDGLFDTIDCYVSLESIKIYSILTKEQYEANCYKVKEE